MREETRVATRIGLAEQDTTVEKTRAIEEAIEQTDILKADIERYTSDAAQLTKEIVAHKESLYRPATAKARRKFERQRRLITMQPTKTTVNLLMLWKGQTLYWESKRTIVNKLLHFCKSPH